MSTYAEPAHQRSLDGDRTISGRRSHPNEQQHDGYGANPATHGGYDDGTGHFDDPDAVYGLYYDDDDAAAREFF